MDEEREEWMGILLPKGWSTDGYGSSANFICPCGDMIEQDGECPEGHMSPLVRLGLI